MLLVLQHPMIAIRDCGHCQEYFYDDDPRSPQYGNPRTKHNGTDELRKRDSSCPPLCRTPRGCPNGTPEEPQRLTDQNRAAYQHYRECQAVGDFPNDPVVRQNAMIIRAVEESVAQAKQEAFQLLLVKMVGIRG